MAEDKRLFLLDAYALIFRAYYAFIRNPRINSAGLNTSAMFGFTNSLLDVIQKEKPSHLAVCFDFPAKTVRNEIFTEYKANRDATPEDIKISVPYIRKIIEGFNIPILEAEGYEADDVIGTLAKRAEKEGFTTYMVTPDKDFGQLVSDNIYMWVPPKGGNSAQIMGPKEVCEKWEIERPEQVIDILGMMGDAVDNIPGLPGVGEKTASKLVQQYGSMEGLYEHTDELKGKLKEKVEDNKDQAFMSKVLATILVDVPVEFDPDKLKIEEPDKEVLTPLFSELEFRTISQRVLGEAVKLGGPVADDKGQYDLFSQGEQEKSADQEERKTKDLENSDQQYHFVDTPEKVRGLVAMLESADWYCFDTETTGVDAVEAELVGMSFCVKMGEAYYVPAPEDQKECIEFLAQFKSVFETVGPQKIGHNIKYDILVLRKYDIRVAGPYFDTMIAHYLLEPDMRRRGMDALSEIYLNYSPVSIETLIGKKGKGQKTMRDLEQKDIVNYACEDADITYQLKRYFDPLIDESGNRELMEGLECPLIAVLADMEEEGIKLESESLGLLSKELAKDIELVQKDIYDQAGLEFNIASPRQVGEVLFDHLKIEEKAKKTKTGQYATGEEVLSKLKNKHPIVERILGFRELVKLKNTYVDTLPEMVNKQTGHIHTSYNQVVAATGRLSSDNPNLQNIPIKTERGREIRKSFIPSDDKHILMASDYSQVELRILAEMSGDEGMKEAFLAGEDIHSSTAAKVFGVELKDVSREMRIKAKAVNFGIAYGQGAFGLAQNLNISRTEAKEIIDQYFLKFAGIRVYMQDVVEKAKERGYVETLMGRKRLLRDINSANAVVRGQSERFAINAPIQGTAADIIKVAMIDIRKAFEKKKFKSKMILQVHDELVFNVLKTEKDEVQSVVEDKMQNAVKMSVPLIVDTGFGSNWLEAH